MQVLECVEVTPSGALERWEQVGQEDDVVRWIAGIGAVIVDRGWKSTVATLTEVTTNDLMLVEGQ
jgi:hypothetical protein